MKPKKYYISFYTSTPARIFYGVIFAMMIAIVVGIIWVCVAVKFPPLTFFGILFIAIILPATIRTTIRSFSDYLIVNPDDTITYKIWGKDAKTIPWSAIHSLSETDNRDKSKGAWTGTKWRGSVFAVNGSEGYAYFYIYNDRTLIKLFSDRGIEIKYNERDKWFI